ncbi:hypothetical protein OGATHE_005034 [Ogataea polymorpha]|uniref:Uncharacterized protein n=1 Tax=Ogataea polymorpha TaxID=460523 RepID=A0A9P8NWX0_9ASCO|nr:hypothetical protein OGATHE_005034 [Ogataea polymorpha]
MLDSCSLFKLGVFGKFLIAALFTKISIPWNTSFLCFERYCVINFSSITENSRNATSHKLSNLLLIFSGFTREGSGSSSVMKKSLKTAKHSPSSSQFNNASPLTFKIARPTWNNVLGPCKSSMSTTLNANTSGIVLRKNERNHGRETMDS